MHNLCVTFVLSASTTRAPLLVRSLAGCFPPWGQSSAPCPASFHPQHHPEQLPAAHSLGGRKDALSTKTAAAHQAAARSGRILTWPRTTTPRRQHGDPPNPPPILPIPLPSPRLPGDHRDAHGTGLSSSSPQCYHQQRCSGGVGTLVHRPPPAPPAPAPCLCSASPFLR